jgi:LysR family transcriptional activator of mexEF-oprN operon
MTAADGAFARDLDLNLLRVFVVVAEGGSVTGAASRLYLTQPAVSAALRRLTEAVGEPLFAKRGRGLVLTPRGAHLLGEVREPLGALVKAARSPASFDPLASDATFRLGLGDALEALLLPPLLRLLAVEAPGMRIIVSPVQFRTVADAFASRQIDLAVSIADELPSHILRRPLFRGSFVCLFDPRHARLGRKLSEAAYFEHAHVIVSYNGDLRGVIEDMLQKTRRVRCSLPSFAHLGAVLDGTDLLATVPKLVAAQIVATRPHLRTLALPFRLAGTETELLWPASLGDDAPHRFFRDRVASLAASLGKADASVGGPAGR